MTSCNRCAGLRPENFATDAETKSSGQRSAPYLATSASHPTRGSASVDAPQDAARQPRRATITKLSRRYYVGYTEYAPRGRTTRRCWAQPGTAVAATPTKKSEPTDAVTDSTSLFILTTSLRIQSRARDTNVGTMLRSTATTKMVSARPGIPARLSPAHTCYQDSMQNLARSAM